jgi:hypothetical protein
MGTGPQPFEIIQQSKMKQTAPSNKKPLASLSLDLDNQWSYMKTHGGSSWQSFPSYLDILIPLVLDILSKFNLKITFFIVGRDAVEEKNHDALSHVTLEGHEVGNHSMNHDVWLYQYPRDKIKGEIQEAEKCIHQVTGQRPTGFRGPGFVWSTNLLEVLAESNYLYDATILPTYIGPLARLYYFRNSNLNRDERQKRKKIYSSLREGLRPIKPYYWQLSSENKLLEIPVTTIPFFKTPFHQSYLIYLSRFSDLFALFYLKIALMLCRLTKTSPSFLLHPLDFLSGDEIPELKFFPGMDLSSSKKKDFFNKVIKLLSKYFQLASMSKHVAFIDEQKHTLSNIPIR